MTSKTITGTYASGFTLPTSYSGLVLTTTAEVLGSGVSLDAPGVVQNSGAIKGQKIGVQLRDGGRVSNLGFISGELAGVSNGDHGATVVNDGTIENASSLASTGAVDLAIGGRVANSGVINGATGFGVHVSSTAVATIVNGSSKVAGAEIMGGLGGVLADGMVTVFNIGTIRSGSSSSYGAIQANGFASITNGDGTFTNALIEGDYGVHLTGSAGGIVNNMGIIKSGDRDAVRLFTGTVINGSSGDTSAQIGSEFGSGVSFLSTSAQGPSGTLANFGGISSEYTAGVYLGANVTVTNGTAADSSAEIFGYSGLVAKGNCTITNAGTIIGNSHELAGPSVGVYLQGSDTLTNGLAEGSKATIEGYTGVETVGAGARTIVNFGTIAGDGFTALELGSSSDLLEVEAGSSFVGYVTSDGGALELASGSGAITDPFADGTVTVNGLLAATTTFTGFGEVIIAAPTTITVSGASGALAAAQRLESLGTLTVAGALAGAGVLDLAGGTTTFAAGAGLSLAEVDVGGTKTRVDVATTLAFAGNWSQTAGTLSVAAGDKVTFGGEAGSFTGTLGGAGSVAFSGGSDALSDLTLSAKSQSVNASTITLAGVIDLTKSLAVNTPNLIVEGIGVSLTGGGKLELSHTATNAIIGDSATARLTNVTDTILGAGLLGYGEMVLVNDAGGTIDADDATGLTIATGGERIFNAGLIETTGTGGLTIDSVIDNAGALTAIKGDLIVDAAVTGAGKVVIAGGLADMQSAFTQNVTFTAAGGELLLAKSQSYKGTIIGFASTLTTTLDLLDIGFGASTKATYAGTTASGVLTVTDGTHTAKIKFAGDYAATTFTASSDGHGGTTVVDTAGASPSAGRFIAAMAAFGANAPGMPVAGPGALRGPEPMLTAPSS